MKSSELKRHVECNDPGNLFFSRNNMRYGGDTMRNYGVRSVTIHTAKGFVEAWELHRIRTTSKGLTDSVFFCKKTFERVRETAPVAPIPPRDPNSTPNHTFVAALVKGLNKLWDGNWSRRVGETFICHTIMGTVKLQDIIEVRLLGERGFRRTYQDYANSFGPQYTMQQIQQGRRRWMMDLIEEFSDRSAS